MFSEMDFSVCANFLFMCLLAEHDVRNPYLVLIHFIFLQVNLDNLEEYVSLVVDAVVKTGIVPQMEAFCSGFNQVQFFIFFCTLGNTLWFYCHIYSS